MFRAMSTAATGMVAQETTIDLIAHNIANVNTTGFKRARGEFQDLLYETLRAPGAPVSGTDPAPAGVQIGQGVRTIATPREFSVGSLKATDNALDLAIDGDGFFVVRDEAGDRFFTRDGSLKTDASGRIVTASGLALEPELTVPTDATRVMVSREGVVSVLRGNEPEPIEVGRISLSRFANSGGLEAVGRNLFKATAASGEPQPAAPGTQGTGATVQGFLETSNVKVIEEMIDLITSQRAYESNSKVIQAADEMLRATSNLPR